ncbi:CaiB/BaiF CoA transferase family protein [Rhodococcus sp. JS3073]|uniref:CaiB/BaiF CoA transferase family protein n=1 Tax=Rhodococcus sp. JS3073 TaxID=3002901 RepID=UPI0022866F64|nr:CaiB/BaiF CoA-transferase family protein [Rhodococcus sp. JS3073]WAM14752.1 CaiB/BaiF CoA-transferase family protein [Rhodococcus sp. JS3073]
MTDTAPSPGPLRGLRVVEIAALGSAPFAAMMLADAGAEVLRINRPGQTTDDAGILGRGRTTLSLDLKDPCERDRALDAIDRADVLIEGFRPGVMERLGLGPDTCLGRNPALIYARMTGWGQDGPLADTAGHDLNYLALTGALRSIARQGEAPVPPLNLVGDYGGGGMLLVTGILAALYERVSSNTGQVVDAAMIDGTSLLMSGIWNRKATGNWSSEPGTNSIDSGSHFYNVYRTSDDAFMAVGSIEPQFYQRLLLGLGLADADLPAQQDRAQWPAMKDRFARIFQAKTREEWTVVFAELDACVSPVLTLDEAVTDPHIQFRNTLIRGERVEPAPAPRYSRTPGNAGGHGENPEPATTLMTRWASTDCTTPATIRTGQH